MSEETVVLLHPAMADARAWDPNLPAFAEHFRVLTPERDRELPASFEGDVDATIALIESEVEGSAHVVGCSDGATLAVPGTSHGLLVEKPELCNAVMVDFLRNDPVPTYVPIRRRPKEKTS
jgi:pimeloyl-ACP methyl ester carboxylesterase